MNKVISNHLKLFYCAFSMNIKNIVSERNFNLFLKFLVLGIVIYSERLFVAFELMIMLYLFIILLLKTNPKLDILLTLLPLFLLV